MQTDIKAVIYNYSQNMKYSINLFIVILLILTCSYSCTKNDTISRSTIIGEQEWMISNLNTTTFRNGDLIPHAKSKKEWIEALNMEKPAWCYYNNNKKNSKNHGKLYNHFAVTDPRGLAPNGWQIPSSKDWQQLFNELESQVGEKLKSSTGWNRKGNGIDLLGFNALASGSRYGNGNFYGMGDYAIFGTSDLKTIYLTSMGSLKGSNKYGNDGVAIRCFKNIYKEFKIIPEGVPNNGFLFVDHEATGRSGHSGSAITECKNGDILAFFSNTSGIIAGGHSPAGWTEYKRSTDGGKSWSEPIILEYSKKVWEENQKTDGMSFEKSSVVMSAITAPNGNILVIMPNWWFEKSPQYLLSYDNGDTWTTPRFIDNDATGSEVGRTFSGSTFVHENSIYVTFIGGKETGPISLYVSDDNGETFTKRSDNMFVNRSYEKNLFYVSANVIEDDKFIIYAYNPEDEYNAPFVVSDDKGYTWSKVQYTYFDKKARNIQLSDKIGDYYFITARSGSFGTNRGHLVLYKSVDGTNWEEGIFLNTVGHPDSYSANEVIGKNSVKSSRLLIQSSISYSEARVNLHHWWIEIIK